MSEEWGTPISKEKIIDRRDRLIEYQKTNQARFTALYQIIDENILAINYMIYEIERLNNIINEIEKYLDEALGQDMYRYDFKIILDKLHELKGSDK